MTNTEAKVKTNLNSQTNFYKNLIVVLFISYSTAQEKAWLYIIIHILLPNFVVTF